MTCVWVAVIVLIAQAAAGRPTGLPAPGPLVPGLDHVVVVVADLEQAAATYRALGFELKPGQPHGNGIRNQHVKFPDGSEIELLTAPAAVDDLTTRYRRHLDGGGDGPAYAGFYAPDRTALEAALDGAQVSFRRSPPLVVLTEPGFEAIFFGGRNASPTDRPEHFAHLNSATKLSGVTLAVDDVSRVTGAFLRLGGIPTHVDAPGRAPRTFVALREAAITLLPAASRTLPGRPVVGVSVDVKRRADVLVRLNAAGIHVTEHPGATTWRVTVPASAAHGLAITFVEVR